MLESRSSDSGATLCEPMVSVANLRVASLRVANLRVASLSVANLSVASLSVAIFVEAIAALGLPLSPVELVPVVDVCCVTVGRLPLLSNPMVPMPAAVLGTDADSVTCCSVAGMPAPVPASVAVAEVPSFDETVTEALGHRAWWRRFGPRLPAT